MARKLLFACIPVAFATNIFKGDIIVSSITCCCKLVTAQEVVASETAEDHKHRNVILFCLLSKLNETDVGGARQDLHI